MDYNNDETYYLVNPTSESKTGIHGSFKVMPDNKEKYNFLNYEKDFIKGGFFPVKNIQLIEEVNV